MRIRGVQIRGLRSTSGQLSLALESGYNLILGEPDQLRDLASLLVGMLYPKSVLPNLAAWRDAGEPAPVGALDLVLGSVVYRVAIDAGKQRVALGRHDADRSTHVRVAADAAEAEATLLESGLGSPRDYLALGTSGVPGAACEPDAASTQASSGREGLERELARATRAVEERKAAEARADELRAARVRLAQSEAEAARSEDALDARPRELEGLDVEREIARFRELLEARERGHDELGQERQMLHAERMRLRGVPRRVLVPAVLALTLAAIGGFVGASGIPIAYAATAVGTGAGLVCLAIARGADRRVGKLDARLAALRVRERNIDREFEAEGAVVRGLLLEGGLDSLEDLTRRVREWDALAGGRSGRDALLEQARQEFPPGAEAELERLESVLAGPDPELDIQRIALELEARALASEPPAEPAGDPLGALLAAAARLLPPEAGELTERLAPTLPLYVRALSQGLYTGLSRSQDGWTLRSADGSRESWSAVSARRRAVMTLALRLALVEVLSAHRRLVLVLGPDLPALDEDSAATLARALERLGSAAQVLHFSTPEQPWGEHASVVRRL